jgi:hypothetical protein
VRVPAAVVNLSRAWRLLGDFERKNDRGEYDAAYSAAAIFSFGNFAGHAIAQNLPAMSIIRTRPI